MIKDRNGKDLTEAEEIKKRWQEYTEELHKKSFLSVPQCPLGKRCRGQAIHIGHNHPKYKQKH